MINNLSAAHVRVLEPLTPLSHGPIVDGEQLWATDPMLSVAISLKRIADSLAALTPTNNGVHTND